MSSRTARATQRNPVSGKKKKKKKKKEKEKKKEIKKTQMTNPSKQDFSYIEVYFKVVKIVICYY